MLYKRILSSLAALLAMLTLPIATHAAVPPAENFGVLPAIYDAAISPDASKIASIVNYKGGYVVTIRELADLSVPPRFLALGDGVKPGYVKWANNTHVIVSYWQSEVYRNTPLRTGYLYSLNANTMKGDVLVRPPKAKGGTGSRLGKVTIFRQFNNVVVDWLEGDPDHILMAFSNDDNNNAEPDIRKVNIRTGKEHLVENGVSGIQSWYTDNTGSPRVGQGRLDNKDADWIMRIRSAADGKWHDSKDYPGLAANARIHGFTSDANELVINSYQGKDTIGLYVYDLVQKRITRKIYHNDSYDATGVIMSKGDNEIIGVRYTSDTDEVEMLGNNDTILGTMRRKYDGYTIDFVDQSEDGQTVLFKASNPYTPGAMMIATGRGGTPQNVGSLRPLLKSADMGEVITVSYEARDGVEIPAYITVPPSITSTSMLKNIPFIVLPHGGPYARNSKRFDDFAQFFASRGYGVLQMDFRGSKGYGKSFESAGRKNWVVMQDDVEDGTKWLRNKGYSDPKRTCIAGWSYGGYAALMGAAKNPELYNCAIAMAALTDINDFIRDQRRYRFGRQDVKGFIGNGFKDSDDIKANSPVKIAGDLTLPLFLAHGELDQQVHFDQFKRMKSALRKSNSEVTYMEFEDGDHYLSNEANRKKFYIGLDKFLKKHNGVSPAAK